MKYLSYLVIAKYPMSNFEVGTILVSSDKIPQNCVGSFIDDVTGWAWIENPDEFSDVIQGIIGDDKNPLINAYEMLCNKIDDIVAKKRNIHDTIIKTLCPFKEQMKVKYSLYSHETTLSRCGIIVSVFYEKNTYAIDGKWVIYVVPVNKDWTKSKRTVLHRQFIGRNSEQKVEIFKS